MSKLTIAQLQSFVAGYVVSGSQGRTYSPTTDNFVAMVDKIGSQVTMDGDFQDKLPELDGNELPLGKTIEEYYIDLTLPEAFSGNNSTEGAKDIVPAIPSVEACAYSISLGRKKIKTTTPYGNIERACNDAQTAGNVLANIMVKFANSASLARYAVKKQLLGNAGDKCVAANTADTVKVIAAPTSDVTGEAFIKQIKKDIEDASFAHEGGLAGALIGAAPSLTLFVKKGYIPSLEVDTFAGACNQERLALPCKIKVVDDFGTQTNTGVYAILVDQRAIKLHNGYRAVRSSDNADGDFVNHVLHYEDTGFISKFCYMKAYKNS